jgi:hypothetical protein
MLVEEIRAAQDGTTELRRLIEEVDDLLRCRLELLFQHDLDVWRSQKKRGARTHERRFTSILKRRAIRKRFLEIRKNQGNDKNMAKMLARSKLAYRNYSAPNRYSTQRFSISLSTAKKEAARLRKMHPLAKKFPIDQN